MNKLLGLILCLIVVLIFWPKPRVEHASGVIAPEEPVQFSVAESSSFSIKDYRIVPVAQFEITARVLGVKRYYLGRESDLSPLDLALGWGKMSDESVLQHFEIAQRNRWYYWRTDNFVIPRREVETHSANMHMIPANEDIAKQLTMIDEGDLVTLTGKLVNVSADDGWRWNSSLTRSDTGQGACELIYVESLSIHY